MSVFHRIFYIWNYKQIDLFELGLTASMCQELKHGKKLWKDTVMPRGPLDILICKFLMDIFGWHINIIRAYFIAGNICNLVALGAIGLVVSRSVLLVLLGVVFPYFFFWNWGGFRYAVSTISILLFYTGHPVIAGISAGLGFLWSIEAGLFPSIAFLLSFQIVPAAISVSILLVYIIFLLVSRTFDNFITCTKLPIYQNTVWYRFNILFPYHPTATNLYGFVKKPYFIIPFIPVVISIMNGYTTLGIWAFVSYAAIFRAPVSCQVQMGLGGPILCALTILR